MQTNIENMTIKENPTSDMAQITFTLSKNASYHAGVQQVNTSESSVYGSYIISKRPPGGAIRFTFCEICPRKWWTPQGHREDIIFLKR